MPCSLPTNAEDVDAGERAAQSSHSQSAFEFEFADDAVSSGLLGQIECAVAAIDEVRHRLAELKLTDTDRDRDLGENLSGRTTSKLAVRDRPPDAFGNGLAGCEIGAREHGDELSPAVARRQIVFPHAIPHRLCHQAKHLVAHD